jgi:hypothetical protein
MPAGGYERAEPVMAAGGRTTVAFRGDDGRDREFDLSGLPLPGWHEPLARAFAERTGPAGGLRTLAAADAGWGALGRLARFLGSLPDAPQVPRQLTREHLESFRARRAASAPTTALRDLAEVRMLLTRAAMRDLVAPDVLDHVRRRLPARLTLAGTQAEPGEDGGKRLTAGFSDGELARLLAALRSDSARIRDRILAGEDLLRRYQGDGPALAEDDRAMGKMLAGMAASGQVPEPPGVRPASFSAGRRELAGRLFVTLADLPPLMMLAAALSERNGETIKELPAAHRVLEGKAVELVIVKRRRGARRWFETVTWEIGPPGRELHHPGGFYLLMLKLTERSRQQCRSPLLWCAWRNGIAAGLGVPDDHRAAFGESLKGTPILPTRWAAARPRPLLADPPPAAGGVPVPAMPLQVSFNRIKTSMEVRRTKRLGGHLPSAAKSNTMPVLFRNYLSGDPVIVSWAEEVLGEALTDAEQAARVAHERAARAAGGGPKIVGESGAVPGAAGRERDGELDTGWTACTDHSRHPATGRPCEVTFLDCFHCGNCLVTRDHLPRLLGLLDALGQRRRELAEEAWWDRYGPAWVAIREDILAKFTPAELEQARARKPGDALLDLIENPWELP